MAEHLTLVSLRRALSARAGVSEKVADDFLSNLIGSIQEGLQQDGNVTINGLGTFKVQDVPARESVNVTTGERFTIAGYKKIVFSANTAPNSKAAQAIAQPVDPLQKLGEQAEEIKGILSELDAMTPDATPMPEQEQPAQELPEQEQPEHQAAPLVEPLATTQVQDTTKTEEIKESEETAKAPETARTASNTQKTDKPFNPWLTGLITIGVFAMLLIIAYFILRHQIVNWADGMRSSIEQRVNTTPAESTQAKATETQVVIPEPTSAPAQATEPAQTTPAESTQSAPSSMKPYYDDNQRKFTEFQATEVVGKDSRLAWVAKKHYGEKALWVFIYEANRDRLNAPDHVLPGMELRIPKLPAELRDINNPETKALLDRLSDKYLYAR